MNQVDREREERGEKGEPPILEGSQTLEPRTVTEFTGEGEVKTGYIIFEIMVIDYYVSSQKG